MPRMFKVSVHAAVGYLIHFVSSLSFMFIGVKPPWAGKGISTWRLRF